LLERAEFEVESINFFVKIIGGVVVGGCGNGGLGSWGRDVDRHSWERGTFGLDSKAFQLNGVLKGFVEADGLELEKLITECRAEVGNEEIEGQMVEGSVGAVGDETCGGGGTVGDGNGHKSSNIEHGLRPDDGGEREGGVGH
jgi:hypothetical protein